MTQINVDVKLIKTRLFAYSNKLFADDHLAFIGKVASQGDFVRYRGLFNFYLINDAELVKQLLKLSTSAFDRSCLLHRRIAHITGNGLITSYGPLWERQRKLMNPFFTAKANQEFNASIVSANALHIERLKTVAELHACIDMAEANSQVTWDILGRVLFETDLLQASSEIRQGAKVFSDFMNELPLPVLSQPWFPSTLHRAFNHAIEQYQDYIRRMVAERQLQAKADLLSRLLMASDTSELGMDPKLLNDEIITMILAGHETTAQSINWTLYHLTQHQDAITRMRIEMQQVFGHGLIGIDDIPTLEYCTAVCKEAMRLHPPVWIISRAAAEPININGQHIAKGSLLLLCPYYLHRHPRYWHQPEQFRPERFLGEENRQRHRFSYIPFGGGPHICIGNMFALNQVVYTVCNVLAHFDVELDGSFQYACKATVTLEPRYGLPMHLRASTDLFLVQ